MLRQRRGRAFSTSRPLEIFTALAESVQASADRSTLLRASSAGGHHGICGFAARAFEFSGHAGDRRRAPCDGAAGSRYKGRTDVLLALFDKGTTVAGGVTRSKCPSAPVDWCRAQLKAGKARALVVNSGNANAFTGRTGRQAAPSRPPSRCGGRRTRAAESFSPRPASSASRSMPRLRQCMESSSPMRDADGLSATPPRRS